MGNKHKVILTLTSNQENAAVRYHFTLSGELLDPGIKPMSLMSPVSTGEFFTTSVPGKTLSVKKGTNS